MSGAERRPDIVTKTVTKGDIIVIVPERGPRRRMLVSHVEHHIILLTDVPQQGLASVPNPGVSLRLYILTNLHNREHGASQS